MEWSLDYLSVALTAAVSVVSFAVASGIQWGLYQAFKKQTRADIEDIRNQIVKLNDKMDKAINTGNAAHALASELAGTVVTAGKEIVRQLEKHEANVKEVVGDMKRELETLDNRVFDIMRGRK